MNLQRIENLSDLKAYLGIAMQLEHATIPPYLTAMYSIKDGTNADAVRVIRVVAVEEMLHLTLAANMLNAIDGEPNLLADDFVPNYPSPLPDGETDFDVSLQKFSSKALENFLRIEMPSTKFSGRRSDEATARYQMSAIKVTRLAFNTIGDFYAEVLRGFKQLNQELGSQRLFCGNPRLQVPGEYFYAGGGDLIPIHNIDDVEKAITLISEQGEGYGEMIFDHEDELAHYYRFQQLNLQRYYMPGDTPDNPTGDRLHVDFDAVYPIKTNARYSDYPAGSELYEGAVEFAKAYRNLLVMVNDAFNGNPTLLLEAVPLMFSIKYAAQRLIKVPIPGHGGEHAAPIFVLPKPAPEQL